MLLFSVASAKTGHNFVLNQVKSWFPDIVWSPGINLINIENIDPEQACKHPDIRLRRYDRLIMVTRDLLNWWASVVKWKIRDSLQVKEKQFILHEWLKTWGNITREFFGETNFLPSKERTVYDTFRTSPEERKRLCEALNGSYSEEMMEVVPIAGRGSSFDGLRFDGKGSKMQTGSRYKQILRPPWEETYLNGLRKFPEIVELYVKYFDITPEQEEILEKIKLG